jgi:predicted ArsR family transcriptional regulator
MAANPEENARGISEERILDLLKHADWPMGTGEVAAEFGVTQQAAYYRLRKLHEAEKIERHKLDGNTVLWRLD